jgi:hypothetical protein
MRSKLSCFLAADGSQNKDQGEISENRPEFSNSRQACDNLLTCLESRYKLIDAIRETRLMIEIDS